MSRLSFPILWATLGLSLSACTASLAGEWEGELDCSGADIDFTFELESDGDEFTGEGEIGEFNATADGYTYNLLVTFELAATKEKAFGEQELDIEVDDCKVVFVDYAKPKWWHPLKLITSIVFDTLEPFAKGLWRHEICDFATDADRFEWRREAIFGSLFQKSVATRKN